MSGQKSSTRATILFDTPTGIDFAELIAELQRPFRNIAMDFDKTDVKPGKFVEFSSDRMVLRIEMGQETVTSEQLSWATRPTPKTAGLTPMVDLDSDYDEAIIITVDNGAERELPARTRLAACYHVVRHLLRNHDAALVIWHHTNTLFTAAEFENPTDTQANVQPRRTAKKRAHATTARPATLIGAERFDAGHMQVADMHKRLDQSFAEAVTLDAEPQVAAVTAEPGKVWRDIFPSLAPDAPDAPEENLRAARKSIFSNDLIRVRDVRLEAPKQEISAAEQLTVYVMTATLMVLAFPVGFGMLIYNILSGENLKMTARAIALTGVGIGLSLTQLGSAVSSFI